MPKYRVEEIAADAVTATHTVNAKTPIRAAREAAEREVILRPATSSNTAQPVGRSIPGWPRLTLVS